MTTKQLLTVKGWIILVFVICPLLAKSQQLPLPPVPNDFHRFAWEMFIYVNQPSDGHLFWESWATPSDVFVPPGKQPVWVGHYHTKGVRQSILQLELVGSKFKNKGFVDEQSHENIGACIPEPGDQDVRLNNRTFAYIVGSVLWTVEGQEAAFARGQEIAFPPDAVEVKAIWKGLQGLDQSQFYTRNISGTLEGLAGLHIMSKRKKDWVWMTFEHKSNRCRCQSINCYDHFGATPSLGAQTAQTPELLNLFSRAHVPAGLQKYWSYFRLTGVQIFFVNEERKPTLLGNSIAEAAFGKSSSCITCHFLSAVGRRGMRLPIADKSNNCAGFTGYPKRPLFYDNQGRLAFWRLDYIWSLMEARNSTGNVSRPPICVPTP